METSTVQSTPFVYTERELGCLGKVVYGLSHLEDQCIAFKVSVYALTFFVSIALMFSLIGIPLLFLGFQEFVVQKEEAKYLPIIRELGGNVAPAVVADNEAIDDVDDSESEDEDLRYIREFDKNTKALQEAQARIGELYMSHAKLYNGYESLAVRHEKMRTSYDIKELEIKKLKGQLKIVQDKVVEVLERYNCIETRSLDEGTFKISSRRASLRASVTATAVIV